MSSGISTTGRGITVSTKPFKHAASFAMDPPSFRPSIAGIGRQGPSPGNQSAPSARIRADWTAFRGCKQDASAICPHVAENTPHLRNQWRGDREVCAPGGACRPRRALDAVGGGSRRVRYESFVLSFARLHLLVQSREIVPYGDVTIWPRRAVSGRCPRSWSTRWISFPCDPIRHGSPAIRWTMIRPVVSYATGRWRADGSVTAAARSP
jgi:hypothetical protein